MNDGLLWALIYLWMDGMITSYMDAVSCFCQFMLNAAVLKLGIYLGIVVRWVSDFVVGSLSRFLDVLHRRLSFGSVE